MFEFLRKKLFLRTKAKLVFLDGGSHWNPNWKPEEEETPSKKLRKVRLV